MQPHHFAWHPYIFLVHGYSAVHPFFRFPISAGRMSNASPSVVDIMSTKHGRAVTLGKLIAEGVWGSNPKLSPIQIMIHFQKWVVWSLSDLLATTVHHVPIT